jgi:hypothetical protein
VWIADDGDAIEIKIFHIELHEPAAVPARRDEAPGERKGREGLGKRPSGITCVPRR